MSTPPGPQDPYGQPSGDQSPYGQQPQQPSYGQQPGYGAAPPPSGYNPTGPVAGTEKNNLGVWALVLGIAGMVCCGFFTGIPAIILGNKSRQAAEAGQANNGTLGMVGMVLGWIAVAFGILGLIWFLFLGGIGAFSNGFDSGFSYNY